MTPSRDALLYLQNFCSGFSSLNTKKWKLTKAHEKYYINHKLPRSGENLVTMLIIFCTMTSFYQKFSEDIKYSILFWQTHCSNKVLLSKLLMTATDFF